METKAPPSEAVVAMDRFVSASSAQDAISSLESLVGAFRTANNDNDNNKSNNNSNNNSDSKNDRIVWEPDWIFDHEDIAEHLVWLLRHGTLKANEIPCEEGVHLVCQLYQYLGKSSKALKKPSPGVLLESLLDLLDDDNSSSSNNNNSNSEQQQKHPIYVRVLGLKVLEDISKRHKSIALNQWLQAPNGLHRIADLLAIDVEISPMEEAIRNQALIVAKTLAREAPMAKVFLFAEVECKLLDLCWKEGGLTKGSSIVIDALELIQELLKHADESLQDLVWQRPNVAPRLVQLLDLRGGEEFLHPIKLRKLNGNDNDDDDDDLDSLLASGDTVSKPKQEENSQDVRAPIVPRLLPSEEKVVKLVLEILRLLLEADSVRETVWKQHAGLCTIVWELALVSNPSNPPVCALPTPSLQKDALSLIADKINDPIIMDRLSGLDRLLYLVCTGGGISDQFDDKLGISQSALAVLRHTISGDRVHDILMRTLAPPPTEDENAPPPGPTVVQKLWNTVQENLSSETSEERTLFLSGALGGIGLMLCDEQSREIMSKLAPISLDQLLESLSSESEDFVQCSILRLLCEWTYECPLIAHNLLSSTASINLAGMAAAPSNYQSLTHLLLGLAMEYLTKEEECGGWTRNGILKIIIKIGISKYTVSLEGLKTTLNQKMPWVVSGMEYKNWKKFCSQAVLTIRKRVVKELAAGTGEGDDDSDDNENSDFVEGSGSNEASSRTPSNQGIKPLQKLVSQQAKEMEEMRLSLEAAETKMATQEGLLSTWKRRLESTPTELDDMLNEFTSKNAKLEEKVTSLGLEYERQKSEKDREIEQSQERLSKSQEEANRFQSQEQEVRDDLERTEQEMKALSQAYNSLEGEFQRHQTSTQENQKQLKGEAEAGSTEVATLRAEHIRLKNDARKADEWMQMAVEKMNEMGTATVELQKQVSMLNNQLEESRAVNEKISLDDQNRAQQQQIMERELDNERALRLAAEERLPQFENLRLELEREQQISERLRQRIAETEQELSKYADIDSRMENEQSRCVELEKRILNAELETTITATYLEDEKTARLELEKQLEATNSSRDQHSVQSEAAESEEYLKQMRADHDKIVASKNAEINALKRSLETNSEVTESNEGLVDSTEDILVVNNGNSDSMVDHIRQSSQEEIYRLESTIRELKDRLDSGLGSYKVEDIREREEEIEELRTANEAAQEWMEKAVEHNQRNSVEIKKLSDEKTTLKLQLEEERKKLSSEEIMYPPSIENEKAEKQRELDFTNDKIVKLEEELGDLKREKEANQGLLDELGIAMDDVAVMQEQLSEYRTTISELETQLSGNVLSDENDNLKSSNEDLQKRLNEFEDWSQVAQTKIADIMTAKDEAERQLEKVTEEARALRKKIDTLQQNHAESESESEGKRNVVDTLNENISQLESTNETLLSERNDQQHQFMELQSKHNDLRTIVDELEENISQLEFTNNSLLSERNDQQRQCTELQCQHDGLRTIVDKLEEDILQLESTNNSLSNERNDQQRQYTELQSEHNDLKTSSKSIEEELTTLVASRKDLEKYLVEEKESSSTLSSELDDLKARNMALLDSLEQFKTKTDDDKASNSTVITCEKTNSLGMVESSENLGELDQQIVATNVERQNEKITELEKELEISKAELAAANEFLSADENAMRELEDRALQLQSEVEDAHLKTNEHKAEALEAIAKWQDNFSLLEEKCAKLEEELKEVSESKELIETMHDSSNLKYSQLQEDNASLQRKIEDIEIFSAQNSDFRISELEAALKSAQETLEKDEEVVQQWEERTTALESTIESLQAELRENEEEANEVISQWQDNCAGAEARYTVLEQELNDLNEDRLVELNRQIESMTEELANRKDEANDAIKRWEEKIAAAEEENSLLRKNLEKAESKSTELQELRSGPSADDDQIIRRWEERAEELSESIAVLEDQLYEQEQEAIDAIQQWQSTCSDLETKCANLENGFQNSLETISARNWSIEQLKSCNENHCIEIRNFKMTSQTIESLLKAELAVAKSEISRLVEASEGENQNFVGERAQLHAELKAEKERNCEARDEVETLSSKLEEIQVESEHSLNQWIERYGELEATLKQSQEQLEEQENEANEAISSWATKADEQEKELDLAEDRLLRLEEVLIDADADKQVDLLVAAENLLKENRNLNRKMSTSEGILQEMKLEQDQLKYQLSLKSQDKLEEERDRLIGVVAQLEEELREANATLQFCVTDGSTEKATEFAANAIRDDIQNLRSQLIEYKQKFEDEKAAKDVADLEIERLREDIAALLSLSDYENNPANLKKLTTKSIEKLQKMEHAEIEDLRTSLFRSLEDLELTRMAERDSSETISKLRLQISMYEQEIIAAKSEVNFLSEAMEELRQTEDSKRASLEYRIGSLENENNVVRKYQANELEELRKELAEMTMEKDVIFHQLKETEKTNSSLLVAAKREENGKTHQHGDIHSECAKLRVENAHLFTLASEDKGKTERRLRELLSAQAASSELDVILERELRLSAETALQTLKEELVQLRNEKHTEKVLKTIEESTIDKMNELKNTLESLKQENARLRATMDEEASKSKQKVDVLTEECRRAQAKAFKFDRDNRTELAVQSEMSKMRFLAMSSPRDKKSPGNDFLHTSINGKSNENPEVGLPSSSEVFDLIRKQKQEIQEERMMYNETLQEHEDLLALVAQQDLEKSCLREALIEVAGDDVANEAMKRAEEFAVIRYGNAVQVAN